MQYWIPKTLVVGAVLGLTGCGIFVNDAHNERNYIAHEPVKAADGLAQPYQDPEFVMPVATYDNEEESKSYRAPQQVLTVAQGSWTEDKDQDARAYFDKGDGIEDLSAFIWQSVDKTLTGHGLSAVRQGDSLTSGWYSLISKEEGWWFWSTTREVSQQQFKFTLEPSEHQRTAALSVELVDYKSDEVPLTDLLKHNLEVRALNEVIAEFDYQYRVLLVELRKRQGVLALELGFDNEGNSALVTEKDQESVLERFSNIMERSNFTVVRLDREQGEVLLRYEIEEESIWDTIWGEETVKLPLENGDYKVRVSLTDDNRTAITWFDANDNVLEPQRMSELHAALIEMLRARSLSI